MVQEKVEQLVNMTEVADSVSISRYVNGVKKTMTVPLRDIEIRKGVTLEEELKLMKLEIEQLKLNIQTQELHNIDVYQKLISLSKIQQSTIDSVSAINEKLSQEGRI